MSVDPAAEEQFGPYAVYERLGVGGMATVHRAIEHSAEGAERVVALKRLLPHLAEDASFIKSFVREAKLASLLNHINIVQIYELGRVGTEYFISMEYIDGRDVRRLLRHARKVTGPPPIYATIGLMLQLCDALDYAHNKVDEDGQPMRLVHRDISPSNLIVTSQGHLKVIDFGIAKAESSQLRTQTGRIKGKLAYMAPEAISGSRDLDARSDIWACGVILHELLTARPLFASKNEYQTLLKVQKGDILPPSTFNQACPPELDAIVFKALARDANDRFANAAEMREELAALKRQYALQTGYRDVAGWVDWAFGLEAPGGFSGDTSGVLSMNTSRVQHSKTPRPPRNEDEDEAVEVVWGSGNNESEDGQPVLLEEVPDVSEKHHRARRDTQDDGLVDDIPTPLPSHGTLPSIYGDPEIEIVPPTPARLPPHTIEPLARGTERPRITSASIPPLNKPTTGVQPVVAKPVTGVQPVVKPAGSQPIQKPTTGVQPVVPMPARKHTTGVQSVAIPPGKRTSDRMPATPPRASDRIPATGPIHVDAPQFGDRMAAQRARETEPPPLTTRTKSRDFGGDSAAETGADYNVFTEDPETNAFSGRANTRAETSIPVPSRPSLSEEELFGNDAADVLRSVSAQMEAQLDASATRSLPRSGNDSGLADLEPLPDMRPASAAALPSVPVVRFSKSYSIPPVNDSSTPRGSSGSTMPPATRAHNSSIPPQSTVRGNSAPPGVSSPALDPTRPVSTRPGFAPPPIVTPPRSPGSTSRPPANQTLTPPPVGPAIVVEKKRTWIFVLGGLLLAAGAATAVAVALSSGSDEAVPATDQPLPPPAPGTTTAPPVKPTGTVKFVLKPDDAEIKLEGTVVHTGSPYTSELPAGIHQIEIHKAGYKSWLTSLELSAGEMHSMTVVLEPITASTEQENATLTISTTPAGLDVEIDGQPFAQKTPIKTTLAVGAHEIRVKQNGVEVWRQNINAEAASDYEFNPSFTDAKKRERAQRAQRSGTPRPAPAPATPAPPPPAGSASTAGSADPAAGSAATPSPGPVTPEPPTDTRANPATGGAPPITTPL